MWFDPTWLQTAEGREMTRSVLRHPHTGYLDEEYTRHKDQRPEFRVAVVGVARCGKSATLEHITGRRVCGDYVETRGTAVLDVHWAVRMMGADERRDVWHARLNFHDVGYDSMRHHKYIATEWLNDVHGILYVCSSTDPASHSFIEKQAQQHMHTAHTNQCVRMAVMTGADRWDRREVSDADMHRLADYGVTNVFKISNIPTPPSSSSGGGSSVPSFCEEPDVIRMLNHITAELVNVHVHGHRPPQVTRTARAPTPPPRTPKY